MLTTMKTRAIIVVVLFSALALSGCAGAAMPEPTTTVTPWSAPIADRTPTPRPTPEPYSYALDCHGDDYKSMEFDDYSAVWTSPSPLIRCESSTISGDHLSEAQGAALMAAYGEEDRSSLGTLYALCGDLHVSSYGALPEYSTAQIPELRAALSLCPDQPAAASILAKIDASVVIADQRAAGTRFGGGIKRVNSDIQPGTYVTEGNFENCYWEKLDASGNIVDNNFLTNALRVEVYIDGGDFSFSSNGCGEWVLQG